MKEINNRVKSRKYVVSYVSSLAFMMISGMADAACSREDVTFYLDRGFTADQITSRCSEASAPSGESLKSEHRSEQQSSEQQAVSSAADDNAVFLGVAIKAKKIMLSSDSLQYTQKVCIEYGEEDLFGFAPNVCPDVTFIISLKGLEVLGTGKKYGFYGTQEARVKSSKIKREIIGELKDKKAEERERILEVFETGDETVIPVRDDFSLEKVARVLKELSQ